MWAKLDKLSTERGGGSLSALFPRNESWTAFWKAMLVRADAVADVKKRDEARKAIVEQLASQNLLDSGT